jgi:hypothetical protein
MKQYPISQYMDTTGDGTGTYEANGDYSGAAEEFLYVAARPVEIHRMVVTIEDTVGMQAEEYGNLGAALTNGVVVEIRDENDNVLVVLTGQDPVHTNAEWGSHCYDVDLKTWGSGDELLLVRWTFEKKGEPVQLDTGQKLVVRLNDNFTGLLQHRFFAQGIYHF